MLCVIWLLVMHYWFVVNSAPKYLQQLRMDLVMNQMSILYCQEQLESRVTVPITSSYLFIIALGPAMIFRSFVSSYIDEIYGLPHLYLSNFSSQH